MPCDMSASPLLIGANGLENETTFGRSRRKAKNSEAAVSGRAHRLRPAADFDFTSWPRRDWRAYTDLRASSPPGCTDSPPSCRHRGWQLWPWVRRDLPSARSWQRRGCKHAADRSDRSKRLERFLEASHGGVSLFAVEHQRDFTAASSR